MNLELMEYRVERIDGDYAYLRRLDRQEEEKCVARDILPENILEGSRLHYEMLQYSLL